MRPLVCLGLMSVLSGAARAQTGPDFGRHRGVPVFVSVQIGGGAGMVAVGGGVRLAHQRLEPEVLVGRVPKRYSGSPLTIFTFKTTYVPLRETLGPHWQMGGGLGGFINYTHGATLLNSKDPRKYPDGYYWFSTRVRTGLYVAPRLSYAGRPSTQHPHPPGLTAYAELGTNDLYFLSRVTNRNSPTLRNILTLGFGSKVSW
ncbi:hypothetical protein [Hymenobacter yonginensis]|uniref:Outer membrane protein beta-barrel domain-containing protein n=1 Tax=Hymenobacter yonginensis TaxID=748197 RepID=A0ABY7PN10_9BACT|nr:hypothetical protein [Hymenobacter yonginensis]WBO84069.1 hypothetical protein O9Z63_17030 [Hymenobacter yonginensis]